MAELSTGRPINPRAEEYGLSHEQELWVRFQHDMGRREPGDWMFVRPTNPEWPLDLGYWTGYCIAKSYYDRRHLFVRQQLDDGVAIEHPPVRDNRGNAWSVADVLKGIGF